MTTTIIWLFGAGLIVIVGFLIGSALAITVWVASGEPDVNGDPEADAGGQLVVCSWCHRIIRSGDIPISHGACPNCAAEQVTKFRSEFQNQSQSL